MIEPIALIDPVQSVYAVFDRIFRSIVPNDSARDYFGLKGISAALSGFPGWYLWFGEKSGVYLLEMVDGTVDSPGNCAHSRQVSTARLQIRYFPDPDAPSDPFEDFSVFEQIARLSDAFDKTGTPSFEGCERIDPTFFTVGSIACAVTSGRDSIEMTLTAPERWTTFHPEGLFIAGKDGGLLEVFAPGEPDRNVPAWDLSWFIFDRLVCCFCYAYETSPRSVALYRTPGTVFEIHGGGEVVEKPRSRTNKYRLAVSFETSGSGPLEIKPRGLRSFESLPGKSGSGQGETLVCECGKAPSQNVPWVNGQWWHAPLGGISLGGVASC